MGILLPSPGKLPAWGNCGSAQNPDISFLPGSCPATLLSMKPGPLDWAKGLEETHSGSGGSKEAGSGAQRTWHPAGCSLALGGPGVWAARLVPCLVLRSDTELLSQFPAPQALFGNTGFPGLPNAALMSPSKDFIPRPQPGPAVAAPGQERGYIWG